MQFNMQEMFWQFLIIRRTQQECLWWSLLGGWSLWEDIRLWVWCDGVAGCIGVRVLIAACEWNILEDYDELNRVLINIILDQLLISKCPRK